MKKSKLIEMITREVDYQISELESHRMEKESGECIVYYQHWRFAGEVPGINGSIQKKRAAFRGSIKTACQSFHEWWIKLWDEFYVNELPPDYLFFPTQIPGVMNYREYGKFVLIAKGTGVMLEPVPWGSIALAVPVQLDREIRDRIPYLFYPFPNPPNLDISLSKILEIPLEDILEVPVQTPQYVIDRYEDAERKFKGK